MVVVFSILFGSLYQFNDAFEKFTRNYFGEYLQCLIESGELPALGYQGEEGICETEFQAFSLANGRPPVDQGGSGVGGGSGASGSSNSNRNSASNSGEAPLVRSSGAGADGGSPRAGSVSAQAGGGGFDNFGNANALRQSRVSRGGAGGSFEGKKAKVPTSFPQNTYTDLGSYSEDGLRRRFVYVDGDEEQEGQENIAGATAGAAQVRGDNRRTKKVPINLNPKREIANQEEASMSLGDFMRYLVIAAMIIAVLLFIGGQLQSISKSMD